MCATSLSAAMRGQGQRGVGCKLPAVPGSPGRQLPKKTRRENRRRRMQAMRVPQATAGRLPLPAVPRRSRHRARAEAAGRPRRGGHRRVRGQARQGAPREQSRHGRVDLEYPPAARILRSLLGAAARPNAEAGPRMGALSVGYGSPFQALLIPPLRRGAQCRGCASRSLPPPASEASGPLHAPQ